jgi:hypothetical protein
MTHKIILFELNEVPSRIFDEFCRWHPDSALAKKLSRCLRYDTLTEDVGSLSPWTTWPSLHRGVNNQKHLLSDFGQSTTDVDTMHPPIWRILRKHGVSTGVGGSLHTYPLPSEFAEYAFYLPDTFAAGSECFPLVLESFQAFNLEMARESARNVSSRVPWASALRLLRDAPELGFRPSTALDLAGQLLAERLTPERRVRRRTYQSVLAFDVFMQQLDRTRPAFATFFTNHVASAMHRYWAAAFPSDYATMEYKPEWITTYRDEIRFAMGKADEFLARVLSFADDNPEYTVWITTSMGQAATNARPVETQLYVTDGVRLMAALGFAASEWEVRPAMLPQFNVAVAPERQKELVERLTRLRIAGMPLSYRVANGFVSLDFGHDNLEPGATAELDAVVLPFAALGLSNVEIEDKSGTSAYHIPEGCLLIYDPRREMGGSRAREQVSTLEITPTILRNFGVERPSYMRAPSALLG